MVTDGFGDSGVGIIRGSDLTTAVHYQILKKIIIIYNLIPRSFSVAYGHIVVVVVQINQHKRVKHKVYKQFFNILEPNRQNLSSTSGFIINEATASDATLLC